MAVVLTGAGAGRLSGIGSAIIVRSDGVLLTAYHVIKDAPEIQVRLKTGEIYDHVELVAVDERSTFAGKSEKTRPMNRQPIRMPGYSPSPEEARPSLAAAAWARAAEIRPLL